MNLVEVPESMKNVITTYITKKDKDYFVVCNERKDVPDEFINRIIQKNGIDYSKLHKVVYNTKKTDKHIKLTILYDINPFYIVDFDVAKLLEETILYNHDFHSIILNMCNYDEVDDSGLFFDIYVTESEKIFVTKDVVGLKKGDMIKDKEIKQVKRIKSVSLDTITYAFILAIFDSHLKDIPEYPYVTMRKYALHEQWVILNKEKNICSFTPTSVFLAYLECLKNYKEVNVLNILKETITSLNPKIEIEIDDNETENL